MKLIIPIELLMQEELTWQAVGFIVIAYSLGILACTWIALAVVQKARKIFKEW